MVIDSSLKKEEEKKKRHAENGRFVTYTNFFCHQPGTPGGHTNPQEHLPQTMHQDRVNPKQEWQRLHQITAWVQNWQGQLLTVNFL